VAQRAEVLRLRKAGWSVRAIANEVFGDPCFRGRVEQILRGQAKPAPASVPAESALDAADLADLSLTALVRELVERRLSALRTGEVSPSMSELRQLVELLRSLDALEQRERLIALHRARRFG
jgi:hypothetical protein